MRLYYFNYFCNDFFFVHNKSVYLGVKVRNKLRIDNGKERKGNELNNILRMQNVFLNLLREQFCV